MKGETLRGIGGVVIFLAVWEAAVRSRLLDFDYLPAPSVIAGALVEMAQNGEVFGEIGHTLSASLIGWLISISVGIAAGATLGLSPLARRYVSPPSKHCVHCPASPSCRSRSCSTASRSKPS